MARPNLYLSHDADFDWLACFEFGRTDWHYVLNTFCFGYGVGYKFSETKAGLERGVNGLKLYMMCEVPSNVILAEQFARRFDGFSIGSRRQVSSSK